MNVTEAEQASSVSFVHPGLSAQTTPAAIMIMVLYCALILLTLKELAWRMARGCMAETGVVTDKYNEYAIEMHGD